MSRHDVRITKFLKLHLPTFEESDKKEDPFHFILDMEYVYEVLGSSSTDMVMMASFQLRGVAFEILKAERLP